MNRWPPVSLAMALSPARYPLLSPHYPQLPPPPPQITQPDSSRDREEKTYHSDSDDDSIDVTNEEDSTSYSPPASSTYPQNCMPCRPLGVESSAETAARLLFMAVKWAKNLPSFASLAFRDQVILLEEAWSELFLLNAIQWCLPLDAACATLFGSDQQDQESGTSSASLRRLREVLARYRAVLVDPAEFACMKAIVLFKSEFYGICGSPVPLSLDVLTRRCIISGSLLRLSIDFGKLSVSGITNITAPAETRCTRPAILILRPAGRIAARGPLSIARVP
ncbi:unnamed protein product [Plutella xylostella]|uniref:(diamondback moth) hypothetical protein n=1 Tax=Plutella xylostella TaxID=51655 RepID=A0A8S4F3H9_PLUXY|nr:unnamed protein product [Plutella xylostella]